LLAPLAALLAAALLAAGPAAADGRRIAVFPVQNLAGIDAAEAEYLSDVIRGAVSKTKKEDDVIVPQADLLKALGRKAAGCDEDCALEKGKRLKATHVVLAELRKVAGQPRITVKLLVTGSRSLERLETASALDLPSLERPLEVAVTAVLGGQAVVEAATPAPAPPPLEYTTVSVTARATREAAPDEPPAEVDADVFVNGRFAGRTPFSDGLPAGTYRIEVRHAGEVRHTEVLALTGEGERAIDAGFVLPLTVAERREQEERAKEERQKRLAEEQAARERVLAEYETALAEARAKRRPFVIPGAVLLVVGLALIPTGIGFEVAAKREDEKVTDHYDDWIQATDPADIAKYEQRLEDARDTRDLDHALGITFLVVGSAALVSGIVVLAVAPDKPEAPGAALAVTPLAGPDLAGLALVGSF
jgi:hypothetical protein